MELLQLRYFCTVAKLQNISRGAMYHDIPQPDMSKTISKLENELGVSLFTRHNNRIMLTPKGHLFYEQVLEALRQIDDALDHLQADTIRSTETLHIFASVLRGRLSQCIAAFHRRFPDVSLQISHSPDIGQTSQLFDLCVAEEPPTDDYDCKLPLLERSLDLYIAVSTEHALTQKTVLELDDLKDIPIVSIKDAPVMKTIGMFCQKQGFDLNMAITCDDLYYLRQYVSSGIAATFTFSYAWQELEHPQIRFIKLNTSIPVHFCAFWNSQKPRGKAWFFLLEQIQKLFDPAAPYWSSGPIC